MDEQIEKEKEDEQQQMEKIFQLIRSTRELRNRMATGETREKNPSPGWRPSFRPEDFAEAEAGPSAEGQKPENEEDKGLDLTLSL